MWAFQRYSHYNMLFRLLFQIEQDTMESAFLPLSVENDFTRAYNVQFATRVLYNLMHLQVGCLQAGIFAIRLITKLEFCLGIKSKI